MTDTSPEAIAGLVEQLFALSRAEHDDLSIGGQAATTLEALARENAELRLAGNGSLPLLYSIRRELGWNDKTALSILGSGVRQLRGRAEAAEARIAELEEWNRKQAADIIVLGQQVGELEAALTAAREREEELRQILAPLIYRADHERLEWPDSKIVPIELGVCRRAAALIKGGTDEQG